MNVCIYNIHKANPLNTTNGPMTIFLIFLLLLHKITNVLMTKSKISNSDKSKISKQFCAETHRIFSRANLLTHALELGHFISVNTLSLLQFSS